MMDFCCVALNPLESGVISAVKLFTEFALRKPKENQQICIVTIKKFLMALPDFTKFLILEIKKKYR